MNDDNDLDGLRRDARELRYDPGEVAVSRLSARVRARLAERDTVAGALLGWLRPLVAALAIVLIAAAATITLVSIEPADALLAGSDLRVAEDYYRVAR